MGGDMNVKAGICEDCGSYWTVTGGGLNDDGQCPECEHRLKAERIESVDQETDDQAEALPC